MKDIRVNMFGEFSISTDGGRVSDSDNRSRKVWFLLAYLIYNRDRVIKQNELIEMLWNESDRGVNPVGALKTLFYRVRTELDQLWEGAGKQLILSHGNGYIWSDEFPVIIDCEQFDELNEIISDASDDALEDTVRLLRLCKGGFLERFSSEFWVMPIATFYHNEYIRHLLRILPTLIEQGRYEDAVEFCQAAVGAEPFNEEIHRYYMRVCIAMGNQKRAVEIYQSLSDRLLSELGLIPSEETRKLYHEAVKSNNDHTLTLEMIRDQLKESNSYPGALICEYDFFRVLYYSMARSVLRNGIAVHMVLVTVKGKRGAELDAKKREKVMANLEDSIRHSLRRGDSAARCSATQYIIMLPRANYENSCMVSERVFKAYYQKYTRLDAELRYEVFPIQPDDKESFQWMREPQDK